MKKEQLIKVLMSSGYDDSLVKKYDFDNCLVSEYDFEEHKSVKSVKSLKNVTIKYTFYGEMIIRSKWNEYHNTWVKQDINMVSEVTIDGDKIIFAAIQTAYEKAISLGATLSGGINWDWANGFEPEAAEEFIKFLDAYGYDHRGICNNDDGTKSVRYR